MPLGSGMKQSCSHCPSAIAQATPKSQQKPAPLCPISSCLVWQTPAASLVAPRVHVCCSSGGHPIPRRRTLPQRRHLRLSSAPLRKCPGPSTLSSPCTKCDQILTSLPHTPYGMCMRNEPFPAFPPFPCCRPCCRPGGMPCGAEGGGPLGIPAGGPCCKPGGTPGAGVGRCRSAWCWCCTTLSAGAR